MGILCCGFCGRLEPIGRTIRAKHFDPAKPDDKSGFLTVDGEDAVPGQNLAFAWSLALGEDGIHKPESYDLITVKDIDLEPERLLLCATKPAPKPSKRSKQGQGVQVIGDSECGEPGEDP